MRHWKPLPLPQISIYTRTHLPFRSNTFIHSLQLKRVFVRKKAMDFNQNQAPDEQEVNPFKDVSDDFQKLFGFLFAVIALISHATGAKTFFGASQEIIMGSTILLLLFFFVVISGTILPHHIRNSIPALLVLTIGAVSTILLSSLIFLTISWIAFCGWIIVFAALVYLEYKSVQNKN